MQVLCYAVAAAVLGAAASAHADPLAPTTLPEDTRWVVHTDVDAGRAAGPLWKLAEQRFFEPRREEMAQQLKILERVTGMQPAQDLKDVTIYGSTYDETSVCIRIHGFMDKETVVSFLKASENFKETPRGTRKILSWRDKGRDRVVYGAFAEGDLAFVANSQRVIETALDLLEKKKPSLPATSKLIPDIGNNQPGRPILWIAGSDLADLPRAKKAESPLMAQVEVASVGVRWVNEKVALDMHVVARSEEAAENFEAVATGIKALVKLAALDEHAAPAAKLMGSAFSQLKVSATGREVKGDWSIGLDKIEAVVDLAARQSPLNAVAKPASAPKK